MFFMSCICLFVTFFSFLVYFSVYMCLPRGSWGFGGLFDITHKPGLRCILLEKKLRKSLKTQGALLRCILKNLGLAEKKKFSLLWFALYFTWKQVGLEVCAVS